MNLIKLILTLLVFIAFAKFSSSTALKPAVKLPPEFLEDWPNISEEIEEDPIVEEHLVMKEVKHIADELGVFDKMRVDSRQETE